MRIGNYLVFFIYLITLIIPTSCNDHKKKEAKAVAQMSFKIADSLLGLQYKDTINGFSIKLPKSYSKFELSNKQKKELADLNIQSVYQGRLKSTGSLFILLNLSKLNDSLFLDYTNKLGILAKSSASYSIDSFFSNKLYLKQYFIRSDTAIQLKVIIKNRFKGHYQVDFYVPTPTYNKQSSTIESVLGSIN